MLKLRSQRHCEPMVLPLPDLVFTMAFQPVVDVDLCRIDAYEALIRGPNGEPARTVLSIVNNENQYAFDQTCRAGAIAAASELGLTRRLHINILPNTIIDPEESLQLSLAAARQHGIPLSLITFELTEDERIADRAHLREIARVYRSFGFTIALDDFGAGYAGLSLLADFQPDIVKLDRFLVENIDQDQPRQIIVGGLMKIARSLNLQVVAEGVERREEMLILRDLGVRYFQGFYFAKPVVGRLWRDREICWD